jgi:hypothetical protein
MKRIPVFMIALWLTAPSAVRAQDAATEERLNKLSAQIEDLVVAKDAQNKRIEELARAVRELQEQQNRPNPTYASQDDLKRVAAKLQEIDQNRQRDNELVLEKLRGLGKTLAAAPPARQTAAATTGSSSPSSVSAAGERPATRPEKGYEYVIKESDTYSAIAKAYSDQGVKVTAKQIQNANPDLKPENLQVGQKIFIPAPQ